MTVWPAWKVQEAGGATSWFHVRLGFTDGARVELLAVVTGGHLCVEDVRARPPLSLADLAVLAHWIHGPLSEECGDGVGGGGGPEADGTCDASGRRAAYGVAVGVGDAAGAAGAVEVAEVAEGDEGGGCGPAGAGEAGATATGAGEAGATAAGAGKAGATAAGVGEVGVGAAGQPSGPGRARRAWPRGSEGRRLVAQEYRAAQEGGADPVLAVMCATGRSRRRSLRLIAQARDAGYLTPRHARR
ncbi:hypothetical protein Saso_16540 [Streptomyces asoensis]|uniref:Uncharacterized protein n=1 Tax=Streptomyces asoensis TaxID=249586 RepID=A0ABQ3RVW5_9ACTN|nr:hypothetical protein GCM10010496_36430 [Streptomyces asoensis]GHI60004.1 hypothetical protein Saso_16540 [Streptomyces asoensis]